MTNNNFNLNVEEMAEAGLYLGHKESGLHPKMKPYIYGVRNGMAIIDLEKTKESFTKALLKIKEDILEGKIILIVGTKIQARDLVKEISQECGAFYINHRWLGGTITNFDTMKKRLEHYQELEKKKNEGALEKYTKKEKKKFENELDKLTAKFEGIKEMTKLPDLVFVLDVKSDYLAIREARGKNIEIIGVCDANSDPSLVDYPIFANDDALGAIRYILEKTKEVILEAKKNQKQPIEEKEDKK